MSFAASRVRSIRPASDLSDPIYRSKRAEQAGPHNGPLCLPKNGLAEKIA